METVGKQFVTMTLEEFAKALERAASMGVEAGPTAVDLTATGIAGTIIMETVIVSRPQPTGLVYRDTVRRD